MLKKGKTPKYVKKKKKFQIVKYMGGRIEITKLKENEE